MNNEQQNNTPEQPLEKSTKYIAGYLKFDLKKDMEEVMGPVCNALREICRNLASISKTIGEKYAQ